MAISLLFFLTAAPAAQVEFRLDNGIKVILVPQPGHPIVAVALGIQAGAYNDPEGRCGLAHLTEHLFWSGATKSYPAYGAFEALSRDGPLGIQFQDANAETLWNLTYFYAARPADKVDVALEAFAEKLSGVTVTVELLDAERKKVLAEIEQATLNARNSPALQSMMEREVRYPKAGIASHVQNLTLENTQAYEATHYRPDRAILVVQGAIDVDDVRKKIEQSFAACLPREGRPLPDGPIRDIPEQVVANYACPEANPRERTALRIAAAAWEKELRKQGKAYVEVAPGGTIRAVFFGGDTAVLAKTRCALHQPLPDIDFRLGRIAAGERARRYRSFVAFHGNPQKAGDFKTCTRTMIQAAIDRLRFEAEGGEDHLRLLDNLTADEVAAAARKFLTPESEQMHHLRLQGK